MAIDPTGAGLGCLKPIGEYASVGFLTILSVTFCEVSNALSVVFACCRPVVFVTLSTTRENFDRAEIIVFATPSRPARPAIFIVDLLRESPIARERSRFSPDTAPPVTPDNGCLDSVISMFILPRSFAILTPRYLISNNISIFVIHPPRFFV